MFACLNLINVTPRGGKVFYATVILRRNNGSFLVFMVIKARWV